MGRLSLLFAVIVLGGAAGFAVKVLTEAEPRPVHVVDAEGDADLGRLALHADPRVTPLGGYRFIPGTRVRYSFRVTNASPDAIRHVVARSVKVAVPGVGDRLSVVSVSDPACWGIGRVECIFQQLGPGETRTVQVVVDTSPKQRAGDRLLIHTFIGRFTGQVGGTVPLEVVGGMGVTTGRFS